METAICLKLSKTLNIDKSKTLNACYVPVRYVLLNNELSVKQNGSFFIVFFPFHYFCLFVSIFTFHLHCIEWPAAELDQCDIFEHSCF